jgi:hypothetical protein
MNVGGRRTRCACLREVSLTEIRRLSDVADDYSRIFNVNSKCKISFCDEECDFIWSNI